MPGSQTCGGTHCLALWVAPVYPEDYGIQLELDPTSKVKDVAVYAITATDVPGVHLWGKPNPSFPTLINGPGRSPARARGGTARTSQVAFGESPASSY